MLKALPGDIEVAGSNTRSGIRLSIASNLNQIQPGYNAKPGSDVSRVFAVRQERYLLLYSCPRGHGCTLRYADGTQEISWRHRKGSPTKLVHPIAQ